MFQVGIWRFTVPKKINTAVLLHAQEKSKAFGVGAESPLCRLQDGQSKVTEVGGLRLSSSKFIPVVINAAPNNGGIGGVK